MHQKVLLHDARIVHISVRFLVQTTSQDTAFVAVHPSFGPHHVQVPGHVFVVGLVRWIHEDQATACQALGGPSKSQAELTDSCSFENKVEGERHCGRLSDSVLMQSSQKLKSKVWSVVEDSVIAGPGFV